MAVMQVSPVSIVHLSVTSLKPTRQVSKILILPNGLTDLPSSGVIIGQCFHHWGRKQSQAKHSVKSDSSSVNQLQ